MATRQRASVVLVNAGYIALILRKKGDDEYFTFPGGGIEEGETPLDAAVRELSEELSITVTSSELVHAGTVVLADHAAEYFVVRTEALPLVLGGPEKDRQSASNQYRPCWVPAEAIRYLPLLPRQGAELALRVLRTLNADRESSNVYVRGPGNDVQDVLDGV